MSLPMTISGSGFLRPRSTEPAGLWTPPGSLDGFEGHDNHVDHPTDHDLIDNIEDIFTLSGSSSSSSTPGDRETDQIPGIIPSSSETNEFNLVHNSEIEYDEESLYSDALSRKASLVRILACMSVSG